MGTFLCVLTAQVLPSGQNGLGPGDADIAAEKSHKLKKAAPQAAQNQELTKNGCFPPKSPKQNKTRDQNDKDSTNNGLVLIL